MVSTDALMAALPRLQAMAGGIIVIKYGGSLLAGTCLEEALLGNIAWLRAAGLKPIVAHGGGPAINEALRRFDREPQFVRGLRVTDEETLDIAEMVLSGRINKTIVGRLQAFGAPAIGLSGRDGRLIVAEKKWSDGVDLGRVGTVSHVNAALLASLLDQGLIPVVSPVCADATGGALNVNADEVAVAVARTLKASRLLLLTNVPGVLADVSDPDSRIASLTPDEAEAAIADGRITGGMIPKIRSAVESVRQGVGEIRILDGRVPHILLSALMLDIDTGTRIHWNDK
jgi:acetylglutamate kinase